MIESDSSSSSSQRLAQPSTCKCNAGVAGALYIISNGTGEKHMPGIVYAHSHAELVHYK